MSAAFCRHLAAEERLCAQALGIRRHLALSSFHGVRKEVGRRVRSAPRAGFYVDFARLDRQSHGHARQRRADSRVGVSGGQNPAIPRLPAQNDDRDESDAPALAMRRAGHPEHDPGPVG